MFGSKWKYRLASVVALLSFSLALVAGCEPAGPAERVGADIDKGIQNAKDAVNPPGPVEKAGRAIDRATKPSP